MGESDERREDPDSSSDAPPSPTAQQQKQPLSSTEVPKKTKKAKSQEQPKPHSTAFPRELRDIEASPSSSFLRSRSSFVFLFFFSRLSKSLILQGTVFSDSNCFSFYFFASFCIGFHFRLYLVFLFFHLPATVDMLELVSLLLFVT